MGKDFVRCVEYTHTKGRIYVGTGAVPPFSRDRETAKVTLNRTEARSRIGPVQIGVILLALATGIIHLYFIFTEGVLSGLPPEQQMGPFFQILFIGNFLGFVTLVLALYLPLSWLTRFHPVVRILMISMALAAIASYFRVGFYESLGNITQGIEALLIALVAVDAGMSSLRDDDEGAGQLVMLAVAALVLIVLVLILLTLTNQIFPPWEAYF